MFSHKIYEEDTTTFKGIKIVNILDNPKLTYSNAVPFEGVTLVNIPWR